MVTAAISVEQRRARLGLRHRLAPSARPDDDIAAIADSVVALHATDPASVVLSALVRMRRPDLAPVERALYEDRSVIRMLAMRRTMFTASRDAAPVLQAAASDDVAAVERKRLVTLLEDQGVTDDGSTWLGPVEEKALAAIDELGEALAADLSKVVPELAIQMRLAQGKSYEGKTSVSSKVLLVLAAEGRLVRTRPRGSWTGSQHRWARMDSWLGAPLADLPAEEARAELVRRWLARFGPGTEADLKWWTGWPLRRTRAALAAVDTAEVDLDGEAGLVLADDLEPVAEPEPWVALLPGLDPTTMGWRERDWYLVQHREQLFDRYGNAGPTVWADGRIVGGWTQRKSGEVAFRLLDDVGRAQAEAVARAAGDLEQALGDVRVTARFRSPLDRELSC